MTAASLSENDKAAGLGEIGGTATGCCDLFFDVDLAVCLASIGFSSFYEAHRWTTVEILGKNPSVGGFPPFGGSVLMPYNITRSIVLLKL